MSAKHDYGTLIDAGAEIFLTDGPNSGGVAGLLLHEDWVYRFHAEWNASLDGDPIPLDEFIAKHRDSKVRGFVSLVEAALARFPDRFE